MAETKAPAKKSLPATLHLLSGAISGTASVLALQPLDLIKTRVQQDLRIEPIASTSKLIPGTNSGVGSVEARSAGRKILSTAREVIKLDGVRGLWRGTTPTLLRNVPGVSLYFLSLAKLRIAVGQSGYFSAKGLEGTAGSKIKLSPAGDLIVGSVARTGVGFILMPFTLLKTLSESSLPNSAVKVQLNSPFTTLLDLYKLGGVRELWRGSVPTALRDAPGAGLFIVFYERGRRFMGTNGEIGGGAVGGGTAGASASLFSTLLTTPFDLIKTRRQISPEIYTNLSQSIQLIYQTRGLGGFWEGGGLRVIRKAGSAGIGWAVYEAIVGWGESEPKLAKLD